jgi:hypothetical protein
MKVGGFFEDDFLRRPLPVICWSCRRKYSNNIFDTISIVQEEQLYRRWQQQTPVERLEEQVEQTKRTLERLQKEESEQGQVLRKQILQILQRWQQELERLRHPPTSLVIAPCTSLVKVTN